MPWSSLPCAVMVTWQCEAVSSTCGGRIPIGASLLDRSMAATTLPRDGVRPADCRTCPTLRNLFPTSPSSFCPISPFFSEPIVKRSRKLNYSNTMSSHSLSAYPSSSLSSPRKVAARRAHLSPTRASLVRTLNSASRPPPDSLPSLQPGSFPEA